MKDWQTFFLGCTSFFTLCIAVSNGIRAYIEWKIYQTEWWQAHKNQKPPTT